MLSPDVQRLHQWLEGHESELVEATRAMLRVPSVEGPAEPNAPYGAENRRALDLALGWARDAGMQTTDLEGHLGYAEFGQGERLVMSLGHLDVVPVGPGWKHDPWGAEVDGEYLYGRGAVDDKGPTVASFFAMRALKEVLPELPARFRQAFGCDEESGFGCVHRYAETEEPPTYGVAPDSGWPLYHAEKGILDLRVEGAVPEGPFQLVHARGGERPNIVVDRFEATVRIAPEIRAEVEERLSDAWDRNAEWHWDGGDLKIAATGKASHGSSPFEGDSAAVRGFRFVHALAPLDVQPFYEAVFLSGHPGGAGLGIAGADEASKDLTSNLGIADVAQGRISLLYNIRYPVSFKGPDLQTKAQKTLGDGFTVEIERDSKPLYFPLDHPMTRAIVDVYEAETGERREPGTMGGGTYARALPNTVSIGTGWIGDGGAHETDERIRVAHLVKMAKIYAHILWRLATL